MANTATVEMTQKDYRRQNFERTCTGKPANRKASWLSGMLRSQRDGFDADEIRQEYPGLKIHGL